MATGGDDAIAATLNRHRQAVKNREREAFIKRKAPVKTGSKVSLRAEPTKSYPQAAPICPCFAANLYSAFELIPAVLVHIFRPPFAQIADRHRFQR